MTALDASSCSLPGAPETSVEGAGFVLGEPGLSELSREGSLARPWAGAALE